MWPFSMKIKLTEEQMDDLSYRVTQDFKDGIGATLIKKNPTAYRDLINEAIHKEAEKLAPLYLKQTQEKMETELKEIKQAHQDFQVRIQVELDKMLLKLDQIMDGQRPQPNGALQELRAQIDSLDDRLTQIEILAKKRKS